MTTTSSLPKLSRAYLDDGLAALHGCDGLVAGYGLAAVGAYLVHNAVGDGHGTAGAVEFRAGVYDDDFRAFLGHEHGDAPSDAPA